MSKYDYAALEKLFIQTDPSVSVRQFAKDHDVPWSAMNVQANKHEWRRKREEFHARATEKAIEVAGDRMGTKIMAIREDMLDVIHAATLKMASDMSDRSYQTLDAKGELVTITVPGQTVTPDHVSKLIDKFLLLTGNATKVTEERSQSAHTIDFAGLPPDLTRLVADIARERTAESRPVERPRLPGGGSPRTN